MTAPNVLIVGGGAAGFYAAAQILYKQKNAKVLIIEKSNKLLSKVLVSGGGRCNVTHHCESVAQLVKNYPRNANFLKQIFQQYAIKDVIAFFQTLGVSLKVEADGRIFPTSNTSETIVNALLSFCKQHAGFQVCLQTEMVDIKTLENTAFQVVFNNNKTALFSHVVLALGGLNKKTPAFLENLSLPITKTYPSLFTFNIADKKLQHLMGLSVPFGNIKVIGSKTNYEGAILITHWGLSGPAVLKASAWEAKTLAEKDYVFSILVNWINLTEAETRTQWKQALLTNPKKNILNLNAFKLPQRLWIYLVEESRISPEKIVSEIGQKEQNKLLENLIRQPFHCSGKTTFKEEFVTAGGIDVTALNPKTCAFKTIPNLFAIGEMVDVDGITGGFNFQSCWSMAAVCAKAIVNEKTI